MINRVKTALKRHWPTLRLRTILLSVLLFAAAMPAIEAVWLLGYENTLVRRTDEQLAAEADILAAVAGVQWPGAPASAQPLPPLFAPPPSAAVDLNQSPVLAERPRPAPSARPPDPDAVAAAARLAPVLAAVRRRTLASIVLLDRQGREVVGPDLGGDLSGLAEVRAALAGQPLSVLRRNGDYHPHHSLEWLSRASALRVHHAQPVEAGGQVVGVVLLSRSPRALFRGAYDSLWKIGLGAAIIVSLLIGLSGLVSRGVTRPIEALSAATHAVAAERGAVPDTPPTAAVEIRTLYEDVRRMAEVMSRRARYLRDFAAAVSHEFKTPLAGIAGAVELLQDHHDTMSEDQRRRFLGNIAADGARLSQLVARLLALARADMARPEAGAQADLAAAAGRIADAFRAPGFAVELALPPHLPAVALPASALEAVLTTLTENSRQAGAGRVEITARAEGERVVVAVHDDGPGVPAEGRERLFEPFYTTRRATGGSGLGLPIARSLVQAHGGRIAFTDPPAGARVEVDLPAAEDHGLKS